MRRLLNDSIAKAGAERFDYEDSFEFYCECSDLSCKKVVELTVAQYRILSIGKVLAHRKRLGTGTVDAGEPRTPLRFAQEAQRQRLFRASQGQPNGPRSA
jgi:hypothetical protein